MSKPEKRDEIVRAALDLIAELGFHGAPMAMIAERAKVGAGTIYRYFESKDVLINELYREMEERIYAALSEGYDPQKPLRDRFLHLGTVLVRHFVANPLEFRYIEQFHNSPYGVTRRRGKLDGVKGKCDYFREIFEDGKAQQQVKDLPLVALFALAFAPLFALSRDHILNFIALDDDLITRTVEACWDGVRR